MKYITYYMMPDDTTNSFIIIECDLEHLNTVALIYYVRTLINTFIEKYTKRLHQYWLIASIAGCI